MKFTSTYFADLAERCFKTFLQVFLAQIIASGVDLTHSLTNVSTLQKAGVAGIGAVLSILFSVASAYAGNNGSASVVPQVMAVEPLAPLGD